MRGKKELRHVRERDDISKRVRQRGYCNREKRIKPQPREGFHKNYP
jgi:hypothetical protein